MSNDERRTPSAALRGRVTNDESRVQQPLRPSSLGRALRSPFVFRPPVAVILAGALLGLFLARFWYELDPVRFAPLGDWPAAIGLSAAAAIFLAAQWRFALRRVLAPEAIPSIHIPFALLFVYVVWPDVDLRLAAIILLASAGLAVALGLRALRALHRLAPLALAAIVFAVYARTLGTHVGKADTFEFQVVAPTLGIAHPTGYPLYVLVGKLFSLLPIGSTAFRVNLTSAVFATAVSLVVYASIARLAGRRLIAFVAALAFAVSNVTWSQAVVAEVYALNALIAGVVIALSIDLTGKPHSLLPFLTVKRLRSGGGEVPSPPSPPIPRFVSGEGGRGGEVCALFLLFGLGLSHHLTTILLLPAFALAILNSQFAIRSSQFAIRNSQFAIRMARPRLPIRTTLIALGLFLLGLGLWLYIPLRWPALHDGAPMTLREFVDWITGARFGGALVLSAWSDPTRWAIVSRFLLEAFGPVGAALAVAGAIGLAFRYRQAALITIVTFAAYVFYGLVYFVPDVSVFLIPAYLIMAIWIGVGAAFLVDVLTVRFATRNSQLAIRNSQLTTLNSQFTIRNSQFAIRSAPSVYAAALALFMLIPIFLFARNFSLVDQRGEGAQAEAWGRYVLGLSIPAGAAILVDSEKIAPLYYLQVTENVRPDLDILVLGSEQEYRQQLDARLAQGQPVYLARFLPNLPYRMDSLGPLVEVFNRPVGESANLSLATFGNLIELVALSREEGDPFRVTFGWRALTDARPNYHVRLRLLDAAGHAQWEDPGAHPVAGYYPTGAWAKGEVVADYHEVDFDPAFPPGAYTLQVGFFLPFTDNGLATDIQGVWWPVTSLVAPPVAAPPLDWAVRQTYGGEIAVTGVASIGAVLPSSQGQVRLNWARIREIRDSEIRASLTLVDTAGRIVWSNVFDPFATRNSQLAIRNSPFAIRNLQTVLDFRAPDRDGAYSLRLGFVYGSGAPLAARCGWLAPASPACPIGTVHVAGDAIGGAINFDNRVLLTDWRIDRAEMRPGETIDVQLTWRGLKPWDGDYTVTVQLIGPDGKLRGQIDAWPVQGTLPTSRWAAGQVVDDAYRVTLQPDAPGGRYRIEVGWYLLATLRRLPVLDAGRPRDDRVVIGEFDVP